MAKKKAEKESAEITQLRNEIARRKKAGKGYEGFQKKLDTLLKGGTNPPAGDTAPPPPTVDDKAGQDTKRIMEDAGKYGDDVANKYLPTGTFGQLEVGTTPEMKAYLDRINAWAQQAGNYTGYEQTALDQLQSGLGGYLAPELQAMREQRLQELNAEQATQQRQMALAQARSGMRGAYAGAQQANLGRQAVQTRGNMEQDLFVKNADEIQNRRTAFANIVNQTEAARFGRKATSEQLYGNQLSGEENVQRAMNQYNISQKQNEALARGGLALSGAGNYTGLYGNQQANERAQRDYDLAVKTAADNQAILLKQLENMRRQINADIRNSGGPAPVTNVTYNYPGQTTA